MSEFIAPRPDGTLARYRWKSISGTRYAVDQEASEEVVAKHGDIAPGMRAAKRFWDAVASLVLVAGFVALVWLPWYTPFVGLFVAYAVFRANKASAADFVAELSEQDSRFFTEMLKLGVIREMSEFQSTNAGP